MTRRRHRFRSRIRRIRIPVPAATDFGAALPGWLVARIVVLTAAGIGKTAILRGARPRFPVVLAHTGLMSWDADWYRRIASHGYGSVPSTTLRFFPLYPMLGRALAVPLGGHVDWALLVIANVMALVLGALVHRLVRFETGDAAMARRAAWLIALAPPAFVLVMGYSEPLALSLGVAAVFALRRQRWGWAAVAGLLAGLARPVGMLLAVPAAVEAVRGIRSAQLGERVARAAAVGAPVAGTAAFLVWVQIRYGDAMLPFRVQQVSGLRGRTVNPLTTVVRAASSVLSGHLGAQLHLPWALVGVALVAVCFRRWPFAYGAFAAATVVTVLAAEHLGSLERYVYGAFPVVLAAAGLMRRRRTEVAVLVVSGALMGAYAVAAYVGTYVP